MALKGLKTHLRINKRGVTEQKQSQERSIDLKNSPDPTAFFVTIV